VAWWEQRVFRNTYTHRGRLVEVKGWSVKIQHQGERRTLSLSSHRRSDAAREAAALYRRIISGGWAAVAAGPAGQKMKSSGAEEPVDGGSEKLDARYWENRLVQRRYPVRPAGVPDEWSIHIEHDGISNYFPLGTADTKAAAAKALAIHNLVVRQGWEAAYAQFPREVTVALHWVTNPVTWTYATFHTETAGRPSPPARAEQGILRIALVEPDGSIRRALRHWIDAHAGVRCVAAYATPEEVFQQGVPGRKELWLVNRTLPGMAGSECLDQMRRSASALCGLIYSIYEDSNQLFLATPGGAFAYLLKRTPAERLLEPVLGGGPFPVSAREVLSRVRQYYVPCLDFAPADEHTRVLENITPRECEILELLSKGYLDKEIAARLDISTWTVRGHLKNIFEKLNVHTRTEAVVKFLHK